MAKILVVSPTPSHPQDAGNRARIFAIISGLKAVGHQVHLAFIRKEVGDEVAMEGAWDGFYPIAYNPPPDPWLKQKVDSWARRMKVRAVFPYRVDDWYTDETDRQLREVADRVSPEVVLVEYIFFSRALTCFGAETLKVIDTHDVFGGRHKLYLRQGLPPVFFYTTRRQERKALDRADLVLAIQDEERGYFRRLTKREVVTVGHPVMLVHPETAPPHQGRLLFVGSRNHINLHGATWFIDEVLPKLRSEFPGLELDVVGGCASFLKPAPGVNLIGPVAELAPWYSRATVVINPIRFGTGLKIKSIEALATGRPLVTTSAGAAGLSEGAGAAFLTADTPEAFAVAVGRLLQSEKLRTEVAAVAVDLVRAYNQRALAPFLAAIDEWQAGARGRP